MHKIIITQKSKYKYGSTAHLPVSPFDIVIKPTNRDWRCNNNDKNVNNLPDYMSCLCLSLLLFFVATIWLIWFFDFTLKRKQETNKIKKKQKLLSAGSLQCCFSLYYRYTFHTIFFESNTNFSLKLNLRVDYALITLKIQQTKMAQDNIPIAQASNLVNWKKWMHLTALHMYVRLYLFLPSSVAFLSACNERVCVRVFWQKYVVNFQTCWGAMLWCILVFKSYRHTKWSNNVMNITIFV